MAGLQSLAATQSHRRDRTSNAVTVCAWAAAQALASLLIYTGGFENGGGADASPAAIAQAFAAWTWGSQVDLLACSFAASLAAAAAAVVLAVAPVACIRVGRRERLRAASLLWHALVAHYALVKVVAAPTAGAAFWGQGIVVFTFTVVAGALVDKCLCRVYSWALGVAADKLAVPTDHDAASADQPAAKPASAPAAQPSLSAARSRLVRLFSLSAPDWPYLLSGFTFLAAAAIGTTFLPNLTGNVIDTVAIGGNMAVFNRQVLLLVGASALTAVCTGARSWSFTVALARLRIRLRDRLFRSFLTQDIGFFDSTSTGDLTSRLSADTTAVGDQLSLNVNVFLRALISATGSLVFMVLLSWRLTALTFCTLPPIIIVSQQYGKFVSRLSKRAQKRLAECNRIAEEGLSAMAAVRTFGAERQEAARHSDVLSDYYALQRAQANAQGLYAAITTALPSLVTALVLYVGGKLVQAGELSGGTLVSFVLYQFSLAASFASIGDIYSGLVSALGAADKLFTLLDRQPRMDWSGDLVPGGSPAGTEHTEVLAGAAASSAAPSVPSGSVSTAAADVEDGRLRVVPREPAAASAAATSTAAAPQVAVTLSDGTAGGGNASTSLMPTARKHGSGSGRGRVDFAGCDFSYPTRPERTVLRGFNLTLLPNSVTALVGASGGGKSSIVKLIQRLYEPSGGVIKLDGRPLAAYDHEALHQCISVVSQEPVLFARPIWECISFGIRVETEEQTGGRRALLQLPPVLQRASEELYTHVRPGVTHSLRPRSVTRAFVSDVNQLDNAPQMIRVAAARHTVSKQFQRLRRDALEALALQRRLQLAGTTVDSAAHKRVRADAASVNGSATDGYAAIEEGRQPLLSPSSASGHSEARHVLTPEAALAALAPRSQWNHGVRRSERTPDARAKAKKAQTQLADEKRLLKRLKLERRVREWIRARHAAAVQARAAIAAGGATPASRSAASARAAVIVADASAPATDRAAAVEELDEDQVLACWYGLHGTSRTASLSAAGAGVGAAHAHEASSGPDDYDEEDIVDAGDEDEEDDDEIAAQATGSGLLPSYTPTLAHMRNILRSALLANAHDFITRLPDGYETVLGSGLSGSLSGGQRQRTMIAASISRPCDVLVLDEATANLDTSSEAVVSEALARAMVGRTVLVIAHRLSTVRDADRICVIDDGRIVESGTHDELMARAGAYAKLVARQVAAAATGQGSGSTDSADTAGAAREASGDTAE